MDSNESRWSVMNSASLGQFGTWVFPYIPHHVIVKEDVMNSASLGQFGTWVSLIYHTMQLSKRT